MSIRTIVYNDTITHYNDDSHRLAMKEISSASVDDANKELVAWINSAISARDLPFVRYKVGIGNVINKNIGNTLSKVAKNKITRKFGLTLTIG